MAFELFLAEPVAVSCAVGGVVGGAVAFDGQDIAAWLGGVLGSESAVSFSVLVLTLRPTERVSQRIGGTHPHQTHRS